MWLKSSQGRGFGGGECEHMSLAVVHGDCHGVSIIPVTQSGKSTHEEEAGVLASQLTAYNQGPQNTNQQDGTCKLFVVGRGIKEGSLGEVRSKPHRQILSTNNDTSNSGFLIFFPVPNIALFT